MNILKTSVVIVVGLMMVSGCGSKKDDYAEIPPEQILSGNAILAPQSVTLEAHTIAIPGMTAMSGEVSSPTTSMDLVAPVTDKPTNRDIQQALKNAGTYTGAIDGTLGPKSTKAIRDFQSQNGLTADGKVGPKTWRKLSTYLQTAPVENVIMN